MKRRITLTIAAAIALVTLGGPATAAVSTTSSYWGCVGVHDVDLGVCVKNPLPEVPKPHLPL